jgi:hypothetical protein
MKFILIFLVINLNLFNIYAADSAESNHKQDVLDILKEKFNKTSRNSSYSKLYNYFDKLIKGESSQKNSKCENPDIEYLESVLADFYAYYRRYEQYTLEKALREDIEEVKSNLEYMIDKKLIDKTQCKNERNKTSINQQSICPWKYIVSYRSNKYPHYRTEVKCTCNSCSFGYKTRFKCMPILKITPVLVNSGECDEEGFFKWRPTTEYVNVACVCADTYKIIPHL